MKINEIHNFLKRYEQLNEWSNFKHKMAKNVALVIKTIANKIREISNPIADSTSYEVIRDFLLKNRKNNSPFNLKFQIDGVDFKQLKFKIEFNPNSLNKNISGDYTALSNTLNIEIPPKNNFKEFENYLNKSFFEDLKEVLNHELVHFEDRNIPNLNYTIPSKKIFTDEILYLTHEKEIRALIQEMMPKIKRGYKLKDCIKERLKYPFGNAYEYFESNLIYFFFCFFVTSIFNDSTLKKKYWSLIVNDNKDLLIFNKNYEQLLSFRCVLKYISQKLNQAIGLFKDFEKTVGQFEYNLYSKLNFNKLSYDLLFSTFNSDLLNILNEESI